VGLGFGKSGSGRQAPVWTRALVADDRRIVVSAEED
jgi:hypothetical protein